MGSIIKYLGKAISVLTLVKPAIVGFKRTWEQKVPWYLKLVETITVVPALYIGIKDEINKKK